jgi:hypothetical protein
LPHSSHLRIAGSADRCLDLTARYSDVAQFAIIAFEQSLDRGATLPIGDHGVGPNADPVDKSAPQIGGRRLHGAFGISWSSCFSNRLCARQSHIVGATLLDSGALGDVGLLSLSSVQSRLDGD